MNFFHLEGHWWNRLKTDEKNGIAWILQLIYCTFDDTYYKN